MDSSQTTQEKALLAANVLKRKRPIRVQWEIFAQRTLAIQPKTTITLDLGLIVRMTKGQCLVKLRENFKLMGLEIKDITNLEGVEIIIPIQNNSDTAVIIKEKDSLCYIYYLPIILVPPVRTLDVN